MRSSANFRTVFTESQNASPLDDELGPSAVSNKSKNTSLPVESNF